MIYIDLVYSVNFLRKCVYIERVNRGNVEVEVIKRIFFEKMYLYLVETINCGNMKMKVSERVFEYVYNYM